MEGIRRVTCTALFAFGLFVTPVSSSIDVINGEGDFLNSGATPTWAGHLVPSPTGTVNAASAEWIVPEAKLHNGQEGHSSAWVGIGAFKHTLIQAGTQSDVDAAGHTTYFAWWEKIPDTQHARPVDLKVRPGNHVYVSVAEKTPGTWMILIVNLSTWRWFVTTTTFNSTHDSAEWIVERPMFVDAAHHVSVTNLPELNRVVFDNATVNGRNAKLSTNSEVFMLGGKTGPVLAAPSAPDSDTDGFAVCVYQTTCAPPTGLENQHQSQQQSDQQGDRQQGDYNHGQYHEGDS